jgi:hypothetical protein
MNLKAFKTRDYEDFSAMTPRENKAKQSQSPASGRKHEAPNPKCETNMFVRAQFEKTKPICRMLK